MVVVEILEEVQQPTFPLEIPSSFRPRVPTTAAAAAVVVRLAKRVDHCPRAFPQVRGEVSVSRLVVVVASVAKVRIDRRPIYGACPSEEDTSDESRRGGTSTTREKKRSRQDSQDGCREFDQIDIQEGPAIGWPASFSWIRRIVRVLLLSRAIRESLSPRCAGVLEKHADSIEAKLDRGQIDVAKRRTKYEEVYEGSGDVPGILYG